MNYHGKRAISRFLSAFFTAVGALFFVGFLVSLGAHSPTRFVGPKNGWMDGSEINPALGYIKPCEL